MKYILLLVLLCVIIYVFVKKEEKQEVKNIAVANIVPKDIPVKKKRTHLTDKKKNLYIWYCHLYLKCINTWSRGITKFLKILKIR